MPVELITMQDLLQLKASIVAEVQAMFEKQGLRQDKSLKSAEVCKMLRISAGTLQSFPKNKRIPYSKIGRTYYYPISIL
jgi:hypothetical protein